MLHKVIYKIGENLFNVVSVLLFALGTNMIVYLILTPISVFQAPSSIILLALGSLFILLTGAYMYYIHLKLLEQKEFYYENLKTFVKQKLFEKGVVINRLEADMQHPYLFIILPLIASFFLLLFYFKNNQPSNNSDFFLTAKGLSKPHDKPTLHVYNQYALCKNLYNYQTELIDSVITSNRFDSCLIVDAGCSYGILLGRLKTKNKGKALKFIGCDVSSDALTYCKDSSNLNPTELVQCDFNEIDSKLNSSGSCKLLYLVNNSFAEIKDTNEASIVVSKFYNFLTEDGICVLDFDSAYDQYGTSTCNELERCIRRTIVKSQTTENEVLVQFDILDFKTAEHPIVFSRAHNVSLMNKSFIKRVFTNAGFRDLSFMTVEGYPFEFVIAIK